MWSQFLSNIDQWYCLLCRFPSLLLARSHHNLQLRLDDVFTGVSIIEGGDEGITMELEMNWDGNPSIILDIKTRLGVGLPVQVQFG
ncbi:hypothetical protein HanIR_Chr15g0747961 [Helianthus annuus]|nr:hypothetical protein HanIR_Chr15g0747961 [Helianthus annuus]